MNGIKKVGVTKGCTYLRIDQDKSGWVDSNKFMPMDFDLCDLKLKSGRIHPGWANGYKFEGSRITPADKVVSWKKTKEYRQVVYASPTREK